MASEYLQVLRRKNELLLAARHYSRASLTVGWNDYEFFKEDLEALSLDPIDFQAALAALVLELDL